MDHKFKLYLIVNTTHSHRKRLYPLSIIEEYERHTHEEIDLDDAVNTLDTLYTRLIDENGDIYFRAEVLE